MGNTNEGGVDRFLGVHPAFKVETGDIAPRYDSAKEPESCGRPYEQAGQRISNGTGDDAVQPFPIRGDNFSPTAAAPKSSTQTERVAS